MTRPGGSAPPRRLQQALLEPLAARSIAKAPPWPEPQPEGGFGGRRRRPHRRFGRQAEAMGKCAIPNFRPSPVQAPAEPQRSPRGSVTQHTLWADSPHLVVPASIPRPSNRPPATGPMATCGRSSCPTRQALSGVLQRANLAFPAVASDAYDLTHRTGLGGRRRSNRCADTGRPAGRGGPFNLAIPPRAARTELPGVIGGVARPPAPSMPAWPGRRGRAGRASSAAWPGCACRGADFIRDRPSACPPTGPLCRPQAKRASASAAGVAGPFILLSFRQVIQPKASSELGCRGSYSVQVLIPSHVS